MATFSALKIDAAGRYSVSAADGSLSSAGASDSFAISPAAAARLVIHTQPSSSATAGQAFTIQPQVYEEDRFGNLETGDNGTVVTASLGHGSGPLQGTTAVTVSDGIARFTGLGDDIAETISVELTSGTLDPAISNAIDVMSAPAEQLVVTTPPPAFVGAGQSFTLVLSAEDRYGNVATGFNGDVTISVLNNPDYTMTVQARNGVAIFAGLTLMRSPAGETIHVVASGLSEAVTNPLRLPRSSSGFDDRP